MIKTLDYRKIYLLFTTGYAAGNIKEINEHKFRSKTL